MKITKRDLKWFMIDSFVVGAWVGLFITIKTPFALFGLLNVSASIMRFKGLDQDEEAKK